MRHWAWLILPILLVACIETPVKEVRECSRVERKEVTRQYWYGFPLDNVYYKSYLVLKNGKKIDVTSWFREDIDSWLERESDGSGKTYCYIEYK